MNVNVHIQISDADRNRLAVLLDNKPSRRLVTRSEVNALCRLFLETLITGEEPVDVMAPESQPSKMRLESHIADPEDRIALAGKSPGYVRGWNRVKHRAARA